MRAMGGQRRVQEARETGLTLEWGGAGGGRAGKGPTEARMYRRTSTETARDLLRALLERLDESRGWRGKSREGGWVGNQEQVERRESTGRVVESRAGVLEGVWRCWRLE